jgi:predicted RNA binding protein YcfA (HicA-like mRNA interferase family)
MTGLPKAGIGLSSWVRSYQRRGSPPELGRLAGFSGRETRRLPERHGWRLDRVSGDHFVYRKPGVPQNLSIPEHREVKEALMRQLIRTMGITVEEFLMPRPPLMLELCHARYRV